jgi:3-hydroxybutyryl-CoA dehydrogenase
MGQGTGHAAVRTIGIVGAGTMGSGIAGVVAEAGYAVRLHDTSEDALERASARIRRRAPDARIVLTTDIAEVALDADLVIEAAPEDLELKRSIFVALDAAAPDHAVLASNTSQLSVTALAAATGRPDRVVGMHWFNPPERMRLIELVRAITTSDEAAGVVRGVAEACGRQVVVVADRQGFVTTRALAALLIEAMRMHEEGVASAADVDTAVHLGLNHPMGPLALADYVGLDVMLAISDSLTEALGERFRAPQGLRKRVEAGHLGRKTGRGYHAYGDGGADARPAAARRGEGA